VRRGSAPRCVSGATMQGFLTARRMVRKAGAVIAAHKGATPHQLMAIFGWRTLKEAERYTKAAEQKRIAAGAMPLLIAGRSQNESG
jgi:hypothetical protein